METMVGMSQEERIAEYRAQREARVAAYKASPAGQAEFAKRSAAAKKAAATRASRKSADAEKMAVTPLPKVGDIFYSSWGYDQTNIDFYEVVGVSATGKSVKVVKVHGATVDSDRNISHVVAVPGTGNVEKAETKMLQFSGWGSDPAQWHWYFNLSSYSSASPWNGTPVYETTSGWGH